jgi:hypothetical protein
LASSQNSILDYSEVNAARANSGSNRVTYRENCWVRSGFLFPRFRSIRITLILPRVLLFLIAFSLRALGPQPFLFERDSQSAA